MRPGLGKTACVLATRVLLKKKRMGRRCLVVAPLRVAQLVWTQEVAKWGFKLTIGFAHGASFTKVLEDKRLDIVTITCDSWAKIRETYTRSQFEKLGFDHLVVDESTKFKHGTAKRSKALREYLDCFGRRTILTGTPAPNGYADLYGQVFIVDRGLRLGSYITRFYLEYFDSVGYGGYTKVLKPGADKLIQKKLADCLYFVDDEALGLPKYHVNQIRIDLDKKARAKYEELKAESLLEVREGTVTAANGAVLSNKLRQVANGGIYTQDGNASLIHMGKAEAVADLVEELAGDPLLVGFEFDHDLARLLKVLGKATPYIQGGMSKNKVAALLEDFDTGLQPVLLAQGATISYGLNLQTHCRTICWHSLLWDWELMEQFLKRVHRMGQKRHVTVHYVIANGTVDDIVMRQVRGKDKTQRGFLSALKDHLQE